MAQKVCTTCGHNHETYYTKERFPNLQYGPSGSPNPPHMRGFKPKDKNQSTKQDTNE
jgi:hypothetical protein